MFEKVEYVNSFGETVEFDKLPYIIQTSDVHDYDWEHTTINTYNPTIYSFGRSMVKKKIQIAIVAGLKKDYDKYCNQLLETFEKDIYAVCPGKIVVNKNYYMQGYMVTRSIKDWYPARFITNEFTFLSETGRWMKDVYKVFGAASVYEPETTDRDYPKDYRMDYVPSGGINRLVSDSFVPFDFEIVFQGPVTDPVVICGGNIYRVFTTLEEGETLTINSLSKKIYKTKVNGEVINEFSKRDRENYIFEKMPATSGSTYIEHTDGTIVSIRAYTERSEPKWI